MQTAGRIVFHAVGDTGGVHGTEAQEAVAHAMETQFTGKSDSPAPDDPAFFYHLGDVIYFNGETALYPTQFYEPYQYYPANIFAIPGNHDGDTQVQKGDPPDNQPSLTGFVTNFCDSQRRYLSPYRPTMTQPYVYWTLETPLATIIGLYSNVHGLLDGRAPSNKPSGFRTNSTRLRTTGVCSSLCITLPIRSTVLTADMRRSATRSTARFKIQRQSDIPTSFYPGMSTIISGSLEPWGSAPFPTSWLAAVVMPTSKLECTSCKSIRAPASPLRRVIRRQMRRWRSKHSTRKMRVFKDHDR